MDMEKVIKTLTDALTAKENYPWARAEMSFDFIEMLLSLLKEQEDTIRILSADYEDLQKEHERLLDKKIPLITNGLEVVRCKDCIHKEKHSSPYWKYWCNRLKCGCDDDWFCADGERRTDDD